MVMVLFSISGTYIGSYIFDWTNASRSLNSFSLIFDSCPVLMASSMTAMATFLLTSLIVDRFGKTFPSAHSSYVR